MACFRLILLGGFQARLGSRPGPIPLPKKARGLLAYLAVRPGQAHSRDKIAGLLWGDRGPEQARHSLRQALYVLRKALPGPTPPGPLIVEGESLALAPAEVDIDVVAFERLVAEGSWGGMERGLALYQGDFLEGFQIDEAPFEEWLLGERERLRELAVEGLAKLLEHQNRTGMIEPAIQTALRLLRLDRSQEVVHRILIRLYARQGRRAEALRQYRACVGVLQRELGTQPEAETEHLYHEILRPTMDNSGARRLSRTFLGSR